VQLEDVAVPVEDEAVRRFEQALTVARENRIVNEWTRRILAILNKYKPAQYPLLKEERRPMIDEPRFGLPPLREARRAVPAAGPASGKAPQLEAPSGPAPAPPVAPPGAPQVEAPSLGGGQP
jgi:hypothetical protein